MVADLHRQIERWTVIAATAMDFRFSLTGHLQFSFIRVRTFKWAIASDTCSLSDAYGVDHRITLSVAHAAAELLCEINKKPDNWISGISSAARTLRRSEEGLLERTEMRML